MDEIKRLNYFTSQFLVEKDFTDEQNYHRGMRLRHNRALHTWGVLEGLEVRKASDKEVSIGAGMAIDKDGQEIVLLGQREVNFSRLKPNDKVYLTIMYTERHVEADHYTKGGVDDYTRTTESPKVVIYGSEPSELSDILEVKAGDPPNDGSVIILAKVNLDATGKIGAIDDKMRIFAGSKIGEITAEKVNALPLKGGTLSGSLKIEDDLTVNGQVSLKTKLQVESKGDVGVMITAKEREAWGLIATAGKPSSLPKLAAIAGVAEMDGVIGIYARAKPGTHALFVDGEVHFSRGKGGYVVDTFVNASGKRLQTGDVVKLKEKSNPPRLKGDDFRKIPVAEVTLADEENDTAVIGVVDREAIPLPGEPDTRTEPDDPSFIPNGGELYVVTLGAFAHCRVDATDAPIEVGDLLTSSSNLGHAKKATNPKVGSIIGKSLEVLKEGTGYIAVFLNIQ